MRLLAFDTSLNKTYIGVNFDGEVMTKTIISTDDKYHSAYLLKEIVNMFHGKNFDIKTCDYIATNIGPGSFTGIRVGLTVARVLAQMLDAETIGINSLELINYAHSGNCLCALDARKNKVYCLANKEINLIEIEDFSLKAKSFDGEIVTDKNLSELLKTQNISSINYEIENIDYGQVLIDMSLNKIKNNEAKIWAKLEPLYIQPPPIHKK